MTWFVPLCAIGLFAVGVPAVDERRAVYSSAQEDARLAGAAADEALAAQNEAEGELTRLKRNRTTGTGWFTEWSIRRQSATVRALVERTIETSERVRAADDALYVARNRLRLTLFQEASRLAGDADRAAAAGRSAAAATGYAGALSSLAEASAIPVSAVDPWRGLDTELPLTGQESLGELDAIAAEYRRVVDRIEERLEELGAQLAALSDASASWERLSRFRSIVDRAGGESADPRPLRDALRKTIEIGDRMRARAISNAEHVESLRLQASSSTGVRMNGVAPGKEAP